MSNSLNGNHSLDSISAALRQSGSVFAEEEADLLLAASDSSDALNLMIEQRISGMPLQKILGWAEFYGLRVAIERDIFIPRLRSEYLVDQALTVCAIDSVLLDLCCGSGALGMAVMSVLPGIRLYASDHDPRAVRCARKNIETLGGKVFEGDLFASIPTDLRGKFSVILANAPYVPTGAIALMPREAREFEPMATLDGGPDGLDVHRRIAREAREWLASGGHLLVEIGEDQADLMATIFADNDLEATIVSSYEYDATVVMGRKS